MRVKRYESKSPFKDCREEAGQGTPAIAKRRSLLLGGRSGRLHSRQNCRCFPACPCPHTELAGPSGSPSAGFLSQTLALLLSLAFTGIWPDTGCLPV